MGTIIVSVLLAAAVGAVIYKLIKDRRSGKGSCGCNCADCKRGCGK